MDAQRKAPRGALEGQRGAGTHNEAAAELAGNLGGSKGPARVPQAFRLAANEASRDCVGCYLRCVRARAAFSLRDAV